MTVEVARELYIAREKLSVGKADAARIMHGTNVPCKTWNQYCQDIGIEKRTAMGQMSQHGINIARM